MTHQAIILRPPVSTGRRIIAISDIHGNLTFFQALLKQIQFSPADVLVLVGDILEKGQENLALLRYVMDLERTHTVYSLSGNWDGLMYRFFETDELDVSFFTPYLSRHPESLLRQLAEEIGLKDWHNLPKLRRHLRNAFPEIWHWLGQMPTILETEHLVFVHGGVPSLSHMENLNRWHCMKNDNFRKQGHRFEKTVIVGHWPVTLYNPTIPSAVPIWDKEEQILSIDGGCVLKLDGQLNALILPSEESKEFFWTAYDGLPVYTALDPQAPSPNSINIRWGRSDLALCQRGAELSLCRHLETGRILPILNKYLHQDGERLWCEDSTDYLLPVTPGDALSLVVSTTKGFLMKKNGVTGWYLGRIAPQIPPVPPAPIRL